MCEAVPGRGPRFAVDGRLDLSAAPAPREETSGAPPVVVVRVANLTGVTLASAGLQPFGLAARLVAADGTVVEGPRAALSRSLPNGRAADVAVRLPPVASGDYDATVAALYEGYTWLDDMGPDAAVRWRLRVR